MLLIPREAKLPIKLLEYSRYLLVSQELYFFFQKFIKSSTRSVWAAGRQIQIDNKIRISWSKCCKDNSQLTTNQKKRAKWPDMLTML